MKVHEDMPVQPNRAPSRPREEVGLLAERAQILEELRDTHDAGERLPQRADGARRGAPRQACDGGRRSSFWPLIVVCAVVFGRRTVPGRRQGWAKK